MAFVESKSVHKHGVQDVTSAFMFFLINHIVNSCFDPPKPACFFFNFGGSKGSLHRCESNAVCPIKIGW